MTRITLSQALRPVCLATALALMGVAATPAWAQREVPSRTTQVQFKRGATEATYRGSLQGWTAHDYRF